ncbi:cytochrome P450 [Ktedonosporobacter rubrisoli]|uniref:Cytochrome P450 n=1 Tax=Ktedonosporobacter rubrisoli TaxID=2509675 RepID=A0A4P6JQR8_KTERU|nr:cytochrome P450 [Ktedonosporobacter rubrisoli]QBD77502.1 cytochrome P450 [Ktedonosporobacter rubrisoli]
MLHTLRSVEDFYRQHSWLRQMRETCPVWLDERSGCWHVFRYNDVYRVITDYASFSSEKPKTSSAAGSSILSMDPPRHKQYRNLVAYAFTPRALARLSERIAVLTQELLDKIRFKGQMDLVADFAYQLPTIVIAEMLGVPASDRSLFKRWTDVLLNHQVDDAELFRPDLALETDDIEHTYEELKEYLEEALKERQSNPKEDMMSDLLAVEMEGKRLSMEERVNFCRILLLAGHLTTTNLLSSGIWCFDGQPGLIEQLRKRPELMPGAIEEVLRYAAPGWRITRMARTDVKLAEVTIPAGAAIFAWLASANWDSTQFSDPDSFDVARSPNKHLTFGHGIHFCIGAPLARMEATIALSMLLEQLPQLCLIDRAALEPFEGTTLFGFKRMPVTFVPQTN